MDCVSVAGSDAVSDGTKRNASDIGTSGTAGRPTVSVDTIEDATEDATGEAESNSASTERRCSSGSDSRQRIAPDSKWTPAAQLAPSVAFLSVDLRPSHARHAPRTPRTRARVGAWPASTPRRWTCGRMASEAWLWGPAAHLAVAKR